MTNEELQKAIDRTRDKIEFSGYHFYSEYSLICGCSNENQKAMADILGYKDKNILTVAGSGEQYFEAVYEGAKDITLYDINILSKLYVYLKIGAVKTLNYEDFINFIIPNISEDKYFNRETRTGVCSQRPA